MRAIKARAGASPVGMVERDLPYLQHVLDACADISEFVAQGRAEAARGGHAQAGAQWCRAPVTGRRRGGEAHQPGNQSPCANRAVEADRRHACPAGTRSALNTPPIL